MEHRLPHASDAIGPARRTAGDWARPRLPKLQAEHFVLMVSELLANAIRHAPPDAEGYVRLRLEQEEDVLRATVVGGGSGFSFDRAALGPDHSDPHLGLFIVDTLADRWGVLSGDTNAVWFEVDRSVA